MYCCTEELASSTGTTVSTATKPYCSLLCQIELNSQCVQSARHREARHAYSIEHGSVFETAEPFPDCLTGMLDCGSRRTL